MIRLKHYVEAECFQVENSRFPKRLTNKKVQEDDVCVVLQRPQTMNDRFDRFTLSENDETIRPVIIS